MDAARNAGTGASGRLWAFLAAVALLAAGSASAATPMRLPGAGIEVGLGSFSPRIGTSNARSDFNKVFSSNSWLTSISASRYLPADLQYDTDIGILGIQLSVARWSVSGKRTLEATSTTAASSVAASLSVTPIGVAFVYRLHALRSVLRVPLVPYFKLGGTYCIWEGKGPFRDTLSTRTASEKKSGGSYGADAAIALAIDLDAAARSRARAYDLAALFVEANGSWVNNFALTTAKTNRRLDLSSLGVRVGLRIDI